MAIELNSALSHYMTVVQGYRRLSRKEELVLWSRWHEAQDERALDTLVRANLRYVITIALRYRRYGLPMADLIAEGNFGIVHGLSKFEPERGNRFVTYAAYWVRAFILNHIIRSRSLVGAGTGVFRSKLYFKLRRERIRITNLVGEGELAEEILAEQFNTSRIQIVEMMGRLDARDVSLDSKKFDDSVPSIVDTLASSEINQEERYSQAERAHQVNDLVHAALDVLDLRERHIVECRLMADPEEAQSLAELGRFLSISRERARQIEARAKDKLRQRVFEILGSTSFAGLSAESVA
jgi:RNA polymerase sigma-32 factor